MAVISKLLIPTSLPISVFHLSILQQDKQLILLKEEWAGSDKGLARAFRDGAPPGELKEAGPSWNFPPVISQSTSHPFFSEAAFTVENKSYGNFALLDDEKRALEVK